MWQGQASISVQYITRHCRGKTWGRKKSVDKNDSGKKNHPQMYFGCNKYNLKYFLGTVSLRRFVVFNVSVSNGEETLKKYQKEQKVRAEASLLTLGTVSIYETSLAILNLPAGKKQVQKYFRTEISHSYQCFTLMPCYLILLSYYS